MCAKSFYPFLTFSNHVALVMSMHACHGRFRDSKVCSLPFFRAGAGQMCLEVTGPQTLRLETTPTPLSYTFDCVASENFTQEALYNGDACAMV